jgi:hypothetical protein
MPVMFSTLVNNNVHFRSVFQNFCQRHIICLLLDNTIIIRWTNDETFLTIKHSSMENKKRFWENARMMSLVILFGALAFGVSSCDKDDDDNDNNRSYTVSGNANGTQMVPSVTGNGTGTITGTYDPNTRMMTYTSAWTGLSGAPTSAGFYNGASGVSGTAVGTPWALGTGLTGTGNFSGSMTLTSEQADQLTAGNWYYSYSTAGNTGGEVRGQITATR